MLPDDNGLESLKKEYQAIRDAAERFGTILKDQVEELVITEGIRLGFPIEVRVKSWSSITGKIERKKIELKSLSELEDLVGVRVILLFKRDYFLTRDLIRSKFTLHEDVDKQSETEADRFGYQSHHFVVVLPDEWLSVPTMAPLKGMKAEIQVRTVAQHIWAEVSHVLQYKKESNMPKTVSRSISRASALLELLDFEFERTLQDRDEYISSLDAMDEEEILNVESLEKVLDDHLPEINKVDREENYSLLLDELNKFNIVNTSNLKKLIEKRLDGALEEDKKQAFKLQDYYTEGIEDIRLENQRTLDRIRNGVFFLHMGLVRNMMSLEYGKKWDDYKKEAATSLKINDIE